MTSDQLQQPQKDILEDPQARSHRNILFENAPVRLSKNQVHADPTGAFSKGIRGLTAADLQTVTTFRFRELQSDTPSAKFRVQI